MLLYILVEIAVHCQPRLNPLIFNQFFKGLEKRVKENLSVNFKTMNQLLNDNEG